MSNGTNSTLILHPAGRPSLAFNLSGATAGVTTYTHIVDLGRLDFNEEQRWEWIYEQNRSGGRVTGQQAKLVPITLSVIIKAATSDDRKAAYRVLQQAVMNRRGGTLQYQPEGGSGRATYYHYLASAPPRLLDDPGNRWDADAGSDGFYKLQVDVELQTQPIATSDPDNPIALFSATLGNWRESNRLTINALAGSLPALLRLLIQPQNGQSLGRVVLFRRSASDGILANLNTVYEAEAAEIIYPSVAWTEIADSTRGGAAYRRCLPPEDANGIPQGLKFTIQNPQDCQGRFAVLGVGYDDAPRPGIWTHQVKLTSGNVSQMGAADYYAASTQSWQLVFVGEFELPLTHLSALSGGYESGPYLEWYSTRASGKSEFRLDAVALVWISDALGPEGQGTALDVVCDGVNSPEKLLVENFLEDGRIAERAYVAASDNDLARVLKTAPRGDFLELMPNCDHLLVLMQERASGNVIFSDDFTGYKGSRYMPLLDMESDETWGFYGGDYSNTHYVEGERSVGTDSLNVHPYVQFAQSPVLSADLDGDGRFTAEDYIALVVYISNTANLNQYGIKFVCDVSDYYYHNLYPADLVNGWNYVRVKKSAFGAYGSPSWDSVLYVQLTAAASSETQLVTYADLLRVEKADPADAENPNATGNGWDFQPNGGAWTITEDCGAGPILACLDLAASEKVGVIARSIPDDVRFRARVQLKKQDGRAGIIWRVQRIYAVSEMFYAAVLDTAGDLLNIYEYYGGVPTLLASVTFTANIATWYTLGVTTKGVQHRVYAAPTAELTQDAAIFDTPYLRATFTHGTFSWGRVGVLSIGTLGRFDAVCIEDISDQVVPADKIAVSGHVVFRTIAPFD